MILSRRIYAFLKRDASHDHVVRGLAYFNPIPRAKFPKLVPIKEAQASDVLVFDVVIDKIRTRQRNVWEEPILGHMSGARRLREPLPLCYESGGLYFIVNGSHRVVARMIKGHRTITSRVIKLKGK
jgi:hypothetical protein